jgi:hypothetical protein
LYWRLCISHLPTIDPQIDPAVVTLTTVSTTTTTHDPMAVREQSEPSTLSVPLYSAPLTTISESESISTVKPSAQRGYKRNRALSLDWRLPLDSRASRRRPSPALRRPTEPKSSLKSSVKPVLKSVPKSSFKTSSIKLPPIKSSSASSSGHKGSTLVGGLARPLVVATSSVAAAAGNALPAALSTLSASAISSAAQVSLRGLISRLWSSVKSMASESNGTSVSGPAKSGDSDRYESPVSMSIEHAQHSVHLAKEGSATCSVGDWKTEPIRRLITDQRPLRFHARIATPTMSRWMSVANATQSQTRFENSSNEGRVEFEHWQPLLLLLEGWHEDGRGDQLVARMLRSANATVFLPIKQGFWQQGTWSSRSSNATSGTSC